MISGSLHRPRNYRPATGVSGPIPIGPKDAKKRVVMETSMANSGFVYRPGREYDLPAGTADRLISQGDARELTEREKKEGVKLEAK